MYLHKTDISDISIKPWISHSLTVVLIKISLPMGARSSAEPVPAVVWRGSGDRVSTADAPPAAVDWVQQDAVQCTLGRPNVQPNTTTQISDSNSQLLYNNSYYYYTCLMAFFTGQPGYAGTRKVNHSGFYWSKRWRGSSGISWTICKSFAPRSRQITMPVPHHSVFTGRMLLLLPNQQRQSTKGKYSTTTNLPIFHNIWLTVKLFNTTVSISGNSQAINHSTVYAIQTSQTVSNLVHNAQHSTVNWSSSTYIAEVIWKCTVHHPKLI